MKVKAIVSFSCAEISMGLGAVENLPEELAKRLIDGGFVTAEDAPEEKPEKPAKPAPKKKAVRANGNK